MLFIMVLFPISAYKDFKHFWLYGLTQEYRDCFGTYLPKCRNAGKPFQYWLFSKNLHESTEVKLLSPPNYFAV